MPNSPTILLNDHTILCQGEWTLSHRFKPLLQKINSLQFIAAPNNFEPLRDGGLSGGRIAVLPPDRKPELVSGAAIKQGSGSNILGNRCKSKDICIDTTTLSRLDSAGAWVLWRLCNALEEKGKAIKLIGLTQEQTSLLTLIKKEAEKIEYPVATLPELNWIAQLGKTISQHGQQLFGLISFGGEICVHMLHTFRRIWKLQWRSLLTVIDETGYRALGIVGLLCALIGVVVAYQMGQQLKIYGANIYIVSVLGVGMLQEFSPLITAIIVAGRTSSAFTAQIGTMKVNQEIDALRTMGLSPMDRLVIPKVLGLLISLPLLVVWADMFGVFGGMVVSKNMLDISFYNFLDTFPQVIELRTFFNGLIKAPVYAAIIAGVGCFQGFKVGSTADSVGRQTTKSVVQSIFFIIVADAIFSIILPWQGLV